MDRTKTHWGTVTFISWLFLIGYLIAVVVTQVYPWKLTWYDWVRDITNAVLAVAITLLSIRYGGILTDFYSKLTGFGISEVRVDRHGADPMLTKLWIDRIQGSEEVT